MCEMNVAHPTAAMPHSHARKQREVREPRSGLGLGIGVRVGVTVGVGVRIRARVREPRCSSHSMVASAEK